MGISMYVHDVQFFIRAENKQAALGALRAFGGKVGAAGHPQWGPSWIDFSDCPSLEAALDKVGWATSLDPTGNVEGLDFLGDRYREDDRLFAVIAAFVDAGSFIVVEIESEYSRWLFDGDTLHDQEGRVEFDELPAGGRATRLPASLTSLVEAVTETEGRDLLHLLRSRFAWYVEYFCYEDGEEMWDEEIYGPYYREAWEEVVRACDRFPERAARGAVSYTVELVGLRRAEECGKAAGDA